jgi:hypothetical protein
MVTVDGIVRSASSDAEVLTTNGQEYCHLGKEIQVNRASVRSQQSIFPEFAKGSETDDMEAERVDRLHVSNTISDSVTEMAVRCVFLILDTLFPIFGLQNSSPTFKLPRRLMARQQTLDLLIEVRILAGQP